MKNNKKEKKIFLEIVAIFIAFLILFQCKRIFSDPKVLSLYSRISNFDNIKDNL